VRYLYDIYILFICCGVSGRIWVSWIHLLAARSASSESTSSIHNTSGEIVKIWRTIDSFLGFRVWEGLISSFGEYAAHLHRLSKYGARFRA
jgi:hypothetical protein